MTTAVIPAEQKSVAHVTWTPDQIDLIKRTIAVGSTDDELKLFLYQAKRTGLDPLSRQIHFVKRKDKGTIQTAIDGYRLIADRTGKYAGNDDYKFDEGLSIFEHDKTKRGNPVTATATVYKIVDSERCAFTATARWEEYCPADEKSQFMWKKMRYLMLGKCAEALALRKAFPAELSGLYTDEEMQQADAKDITGQGSHEDAKPSITFQPGTLYEGTLKSYVAPISKPKGETGSKPQKLVIDVDGSELTIGGFASPIPHAQIPPLVGKRVQVSYDQKGNYTNLTHLALAPDKPAEETPMTGEELVAQAIIDLGGCWTVDAIDELIGRMWENQQILALPEALREQIKTKYDQVRKKLAGK